MPKEGCPQPNTCFILAARNRAITENDSGAVHYIDNRICADCLTMQAIQNALQEGYTAMRSRYLADHPRETVNNIPFSCSNGGSGQ